MDTDDTPGVRALVTTLQRICEKLPSSEQYVMVHHPAFRVGKKPFAIAGMLHGRGGVTLSVNLGPEMQHELLHDVRFTRTPYIGQHGWVTVAHKELESGELESLVSESWRRIAGKKQLAALEAQVEAAPKRDPSGATSRATRAKLADKAKPAEKAKPAAKKTPATNKAGESSRA